MSEAESWVRACAVADVAKEDVKRWDHGNRSFAIFRSSDDKFYVTDNSCTHEYAQISEGYVEGNVVECPKHAGRFDFRTGKALGPPVCINLKTYQVNVEDGAVFVLLS